MLILFAPAVLLGTAFSLGVLRLLRPRFRFMWLTSFAVAWVAWFSVLLWQAQSPSPLALPSWGSTVKFPIGPVLSANGLSWALSFALTSLLVASLLVAPARTDFRNSLGWAVSLAFVGLALLAVTADNLLTTVLAWAALDISEVSLTLRWASDRDSSSRLITAFSVRAASLALALLALVLGSAGGGAAGTDLMLIAAVAVRLIVIPFQMGASSSTYVQSGLGLTLPLGSAAATLGALARIRPAGIASPFLVVMLLLSAVMALSAGWRWLRGAGGISSLAFPVLGISSLAMGSALQGNAAGATGWAVALVLATGALSLAATRQTRLSRAAIVGAWSLSALPFSVSAAAWSHQDGSAVWSLPAFVLAQAILLAGFLRYATRASTEATLDSQPAWLRGMYHGGLALVLVVQLALGLWGWDGAGQAGLWPAGLAATALGFAIFWASSRLPISDSGPFHRVQQAGVAFSRFFIALLRGAYQALQALLLGVTSLLEGDAGIMWGVLLLALFVSLIVGGKP
jgi:hypothetical protein